MISCNCLADVVEWPPLGTATPCRSGVDKTPGSGVPVEVAKRPRGGGKVKRPDQLRRKNEALRVRLAPLSRARLHITEDLDIDAVLQGMLDSAQALTGARYGAMTLLDDGGEVQALLSSGMAAGETDHCVRSHSPECRGRDSRRNGPPRRCTSLGRRFSSQEPSGWPQTMGTRGFGERRSLPWCRPSPVPNYLG